MFFSVGALTFLATLLNSVSGSQTITDDPTTDMNALTDDLFNRFGAKGAPIDECVSAPVANRSFEDNKFIFNEIETSTRSKPSMMDWDTPTTPRVVAIATITHTTPTHLQTAEQLCRQSPIPWARRSN